MKKYLTFAMIIIIYMLYGLYLSTYKPLVLSSDYSPIQDLNFYDYKGVTNVHSRHSTGSGEISQIVSAAQNVGLDYIIITDLNHFEKQFEKEGYYGQLLVLIDGEYSYLNSRLLLLDAPEETDLKGAGQSQVVIGDMLSRKAEGPREGMLVLAHPNRARYQMNEPLPPGLDGLEILNLKSLWEESWLQTKASFFWSLLIYPFTQHLSFLRFVKYPEENLALWDRENKNKHMVGFFGTDAEAKVQISDFGSVVFPSYETLFSIGSNHVLLQAELTGNFASDRRKLTEALRRGQFYMALDTIADPRGFYAYIQDIDGRIHMMGSEIEWKAGMELVIHLPRKPLVPFDIILYKDGEKMLISNSEETRYVLHSPGAYRIYVRVIPTLPLPDGKKWMPWILTNAFYVREP